MKKTNFNASNAVNISGAIESILTGESSRVDIGKEIKVYACGSNVIRIDLKVTEEED